MSLFLSLLLLSILGLCTWSIVRALVEAQPYVARLRQDVAAGVPSVTVNWCDPAAAPDLERRDRVQAMRMARPRHRTPKPVTHRLHQFVGANAA